MISYLSNRTQIVKNGEARSEIQNVITGIPQGTCLGPLLYLIYTNDLVTATGAEDTYLYADDTALLDKGKDIEEISKKLEERVIKADDWFKNNGLDINERKSDFIIIASEHNVDREKHKKAKLSVRGIEIKVVEQVKYLGITIDNRLKWKAQIKETKNKLNRLMPLIYKIKNDLDLRLKKLLYTSVVESRLAYAIETWGNADKSEMEKIQRTQNKIIRLLFREGKKENVEEIRNRIGILNCWELNIERLAKKGWDLIKNNGNKRGNLNMKWKERRSGMNTREEDKELIVVPKWHNRWGERRPEVKIPKIINYLKTFTETGLKNEKVKKYPKQNIKKVLMKESNKEWLESFWKK